jgi:hypothetical protein
MIAAFFILNAPVNHTLQNWTPASMPGDWHAYRLRWQAGHAIAAALSIFGVAALTRARILEGQRSTPIPKFGSFRRISFLRTSV